MYFNQQSTHFLIYNKDIVMFGGRKYEIFYQMQQRTDMICT
jgi:hypothetical protein